MKKTSITIIATLLILAGLLLNQWTISLLFSADNQIDSLYYRVVIWAFDILMVLLGILAFKFRKHLRLPTKKESLLLLFGVIVGLVALEGIGRVWLSKVASDSTFATFATYNMLQKRKQRYSRHPYLSWYPTPDYENVEGDKHNSLGFRGEKVKNPKPKNQYRIVALGGSTTYTTGVPTYKKSYPYLLQRKLNNQGYKKDIRVINAGVGNYDSWNNLINLEFRVLGLNPDLLILYMGDNDFETRFVYPFKEYKADNTGRIKPPPIPNINPLDRSVVARMLMVPLNLSKSYGYLSSLNSASTCVYDDWMTQKVNGTYPSGIFEKHSALEILERNPPTYAKRNVTNIVSIAKEHGIKVLLTSFAFSPLSKETSSKVYQQGISENNQILKQIANKYNMPFFDFAEVMPTKKKFWHGAVHVNTDGAMKKAQLFANYIDNNNLIK